MKESKYQTMIMVGITLVFLSGVMIYVSLTSPRVYVEETTSHLITYDVQTQATQGQTVVQTTQATANTTKQYTKSYSNVVNLNTCTQEELTRISGIGEKRAMLIIAYREEIGGYTSVEQIKNIRGIGDATFEKVAPYLAV